MTAFLICIIAGKTLKFKPKQAHGNFAQVLQKQTVNVPPPYKYHKEHISTHGQSPPFKVIHDGYLHLQNI